MDQSSQHCLKQKTLSQFGKDFIVINIKEGRVFIPFWTRCSTLPPDSKHSSSKTRTQFWVQVKYW